MNADCVSGADGWVVSATWCSCVMTSCGSNAALFDSPALARLPVQRVGPATTVNDCSAVHSAAAAVVDSAEGGGNSSRSAPSCCTRAEGKGGAWRVGCCCRRWVVSVLAGMWNSEVDRAVIVGAGSCSWSARRFERCGGARCCGGAAVNGDSPPLAAGIAAIVCE